MTPTTLTKPESEKTALEAMPSILAGTARLREAGAELLDESGCRLFRMALRFRRYANDARLDARAAEAAGDIRRYRAAFADQRDYRRKALTHIDSARGFYLPHIKSQMEARYGARSSH